VDVPLRLATRLWLAAQFARVDVAGASLSIAPLGVSLLLVAVGAGAATLAVQHAFDAAPPPSERGRWLVRLGGAFVVGHVAVATGAAVVTLAPGQVPRAVAGALLVGLVMAWWGVGRALGWRLNLEIVRLRWPRWLDALPRALAAGSGAAVAGGALACFLALAAHHDRVVALGAALDAGKLGGALLLVLQAAWLPNVVLWAVSWTCGAGFLVGQGSIVAPLATRVGMLPSIPLFGALPEPGLASKAMALWLLAPVAAGVAAAWVLVRALLDDAAVRGLPSARPDVTGLVGTLAGALTGLAVAAAAGLAGGDVGHLRLVGLGASLPGLFLLAPTIMAMAGLATGLLVGWRHYERAGKAPAVTL